MKRTIRISDEKWEKLTFLKEGSGSSYTYLIDKAIGAFLEKNEHLFPLKEDPKEQKKREETPLATIDMSKLKLESNEETVEW